MEQLARGRHFLAAFILFILVAQPLFGVDKQAEGMALIQRAVDLTDLRGSGPYRMRSSLTVHDEALGTRTGIDVDNALFVSPALVC